MADESTVLDTLELFSGFIDGTKPRLYVRVYGTKDRKESREYIHDLERCADEGMSGSSTSEDTHNTMAQYAGSISQILAYNDNGLELNHLAYLSHVVGPTAKPDRTTDYLLRLNRANVAPNGLIVLFGSGSIYNPDGAGMALEQLMELTLSNGKV